MWLRNGTDLAEDALFLAGEPALGQNSQYEPVVYEWLTVVERSLVSGGQFGPSVIQPYDWPWCRAWPRGAIQLQIPFYGAGGFGMTVVPNQTAVTLSAPLPFPPLHDLAGWRIHRADTAARHLIRQASNVTIDLWEPWTGPMLAADTNWVAYPDTYLLPDDFVRGCSPLFLYVAASFWQGFEPFTREIEVVDPSDLETLYPPPLTMTGMPVMAARVTEDRLRFSHYPLLTDQPVQIEFEYIRRPEFITAGSIPRIPLEHRRLLSYGAAYLILDDKDDSGAMGLWQKFQAQYKAMGDEYRRSTRRMSPGRWGRMMPSIISTGGGVTPYRGLWW